MHDFKHEQPLAPPSLALESLSAIISFNDPQVLTMHAAHPVQQAAQLCLAWESLSIVNVGLAIHFTSHPFER
jgi:hypothetical protein